MGKIAVVGSVNADMILRVEHVPREGETVLGNRFVTSMGGKGANQAVAAARAGGEVSLVARVGDDAFGRDAIRSFESEGIRTDYVVRDSVNPTGVALIFVDSNGDNSIGVASGANFALNAADIERAAGAIAEADFLLVQLEVPDEAAVAAILIAARNNVPVILNPAPARRLRDDVLARVSILTPNRVELEALSGQPARNDAEILEAARSIQPWGVETIIVTLGAAGALILDNGTPSRVEAHRVKAVDSTAAGDVFSGALAAALGEGRLLPEAVASANAAAALSVTRPGAQPSIPFRGEVLEFLSRERDGSLAK